MDDIIDKLASLLIPVLLIGDTYSEWAQSVEPELLMQVHNAFLAILLMGRKEEIPSLYLGFVAAAQKELARQRKIPPEAVYFKAWNPDS